LEDTEQGRTVGQYLELVTELGRSTAGLYALARTLRAADDLDEAVRGPYASYTAIVSDFYSAVRGELEERAR